MNFWRKVGVHVVADHTYGHETDLAITTDLGHGKAFQVHREGVVGLAQRPFLLCSADQGVGGEQAADMDPARRAFYEAFACALEPWDGPATLQFTDGEVIELVPQGGKRYYYPRVRFEPIEDVPVEFVSSVGSRPAMGPSG